MKKKFPYMSSTDTILVLVLDAGMKMRAGDECGGIPVNSAPSKTLRKYFNKNYFLFRFSLCWFMNSKVCYKFITFF